ncbi:variant erythrocyte surface antigen-1 family protein [Babesia caballi]|uniref:Variant erythrocyte surface antigen-1 family protein n=1 Tax=Babesia caballi TaxID=5871 RepID=A0AAV4LMN8_BABCB|nr:variant erythrocyte surface antigen-1 family protein [Babesia caballi]
MSAPDTGNKLTDCPSNLKEAIDWILRVTGKDGGGSDDSTVELAKQLHMLLKDVSKDDIGQSGREAEVVKRLTGLLGDHESHEVLQGLITSLASGLATFIGYSGGILTGSPTPIITGAGIAPSNVAKVQVADAVLCFVIGFLRGLNRANVQISNASWETDVKNVIPKLEECLGTGTVPKGFRELVTQIRTQIVEIDKSINSERHGLKTKFKQVFDQLNGLGQNLTPNGNISVTNLVTRVVSYFGRLKGQMKSANSNQFGNVCGLLVQPFYNLKAQATKTNVPIDIKKLQIQIPTISSCARELSQDVNGVKSSNPALAPILSAVHGGATSFIEQLKEGHYVSSYMSTAMWDQLQNDAKRATRIFLCCILIIFTGLTYLYWCCSESNGWSAMALGGDSSPRNALQNFMVGMGYSDISQLNQNKTGKHIAQIFRNSSISFGEFEGAYGSTVPSYTDFLDKLVKHTESNLISKATKVTICGLYAAACTYFQSQTKHGSEIVSALKEIKNTLNILNTSSSQDYGTLQQQLKELVRTVESFEPDVPPSASSGGAAVAGTLVTATLFGGGSAVYFNVANIAGTIKSLLGAVQFTP